MIERFENTREFGNFDEMAAGLEQTDTSHAHTADGKFSMQQLDQRDASSDDIASGFLGDRFDTELLRGQLQNFVFDKAYGFVGPVDRIPGITKKPIAFQTAIA